MTNPLGTIPEAIVLGDDDIAYYSQLIPNEVASAYLAEFADCGDADLMAIAANDVIQGCMIESLYNGWY